MSNPQFRPIQAHRLTVDPDVQRARTPARVRGIEKAWNENAVGALVVSCRADSTLVIIDGGHRHEAGKRRHGDDWQAPCLVYRGLTRDDEYRMFLDLNDTKKLRPLDRFRVEVGAGEPQALLLTGIMAEFDLTAGNQVKAITAVQEVLRGTDVPGADRTVLHPNAVRAMFDVALGAWGTQKSLTLNGHVMRGIGSVFVAHPDADQARLTRRLAQQGSQDVFYGLMKQGQWGTHNGLWRIGARLAVDHLNHRVGPQRRLSYVWGVAA